MRVTLKASNEVPLSVAAVDFIHVSMDKHRQATEKIQARMLESLFSCGLCFSGNFCSLIMFKCVRASVS